MENKKTFEAVNWNKPSTDYVEMFWQQNIRQFWVSDEYSPFRDISVWSKLEPKMKLAYRQALGGLTLLDTEQSTVGMPQLMDGIVDLQCKSVLAFMTMMESIHARSYSTIFTTVCTNEEIEETFTFVKTNPQLQYKAGVVDEYYRKAYENKEDNKAMFLGLAISVLLETFLFYSGFFLPLWLAGQGMMVASAEIIKKIVADESIHGVFVGMLAQEFFNKLSPTEQDEALVELYDTMDKLYENEIQYTYLVYTDINLTSEVKEYIKYNANKALNNLGLEERYEVKEINPIVINALRESTSTTKHDFFSKKSGNYQIATDIQPILNEDFKLDLSLPL